jgi:hypothetical protein
MQEAYRALPDETQAAPPVIGSDRVILYAIVDRGVSYSGKQRLFVGDKLLGQVPRIAICRSLRKDLKDYLVLFCDKRWRMLGMTGAKSLTAAKAEAERHYLGLSEKWVRLDTSVKAAKQWLAERYPEDVCSFCGQLSFEAEAMFTGNSAVICSSCVDALAAELKRRAQG